MQQMIKKKKKKKRKERRGRKKKKKALNNLNHSCSEQLEQLCLNKSTVQVKMLIYFIIFFPRMFKTVNKNA